MIKTTKINHSVALHKLFLQEGYNLSCSNLVDLVTGLTWFERYALSLCNDLETSFKRKQSKKYHDIYEKKLTELYENKKFPKFKITYDPRGFTFKVFFESEIYNTWGGKESGFGLPTKEAWQDEKKNFLEYLKD